MTTTTADALRAWAKGIYPTEAGVELLIRSGRAVSDGAPWITRDGDMAWIDVDELLRETGAWSGGERRLVRIAASLLGGPQTKPPNSFDTVGTWVTARSPTWCICWRRRAYALPHSSKGTMTSMLSASTVMAFRMPS